MKRILLCLILIFSGGAYAQIVNIPDPAFKQILSGAAIAKDVNGEWIEIDTNNDGQIQVSEATDVWELHNLFADEVESLEGLESFTNLREIVFLYLQIPTSDILSTLPNLERLELREMSATCFNLSECVQLQKLHLFNVNGATDSSIESLVNLTDIYLNFVDFDGGTELDLSGMSNLRKFEFLAAGEFSSIIIGDNAVLETIIMDIVTDTVVLGDLPALVKFDVLLPFSELDFSNSPLLDSLHAVVDGTINLKNGKTTYDSFWLNCAHNSYVCIDEGEEEYFNSGAFEYVVINTYCSFLPGGDHNTISGSLIIDSDNDGCDNTDPGSPFAKVKIEDGTNSGYAYGNLSGAYSFFTEEGTFTLTPEFENDWFVATPPSATITLATVDNSTTAQDFCLTANGVHPDLGALIMPAVTAQPGFDATYRIVYFNKGNQTISGSVFFSFDDARMDYVSASPAEDFISGNIRGWNYTDLKPFESRNIFVTLNTNSPQETPAVNIGDILPFSVTAMPTTGDETPSDNLFEYYEAVTGSFDPNDITCLEGEVAGPDMIGEYLHYNINFENTGDAAATFIVVKQVIDEEQFDITTLQPIHTSHDVTVKAEGNIVEYRFDDIDLGPLEKGNIVFKIKSLNTLQVGDDVMQKAEIFFDYNWPIITNEAVTVFEVLGTGDYEFDNTVKIYPNPVKDNLNITAGHGLKSIELYDLQGRLLQTALVNGNDATLNLSGRAAGVYFVKVMTEKGVKVEKIINE